MRGWICAAAAATVAALVMPASAGPAVVIPADDSRTHALAARNALSLSSWTALVPDATATWFQVGVGPIRWKLPFRGASMGELDQWTVRGRVGFFLPADSTGAELTWAPVTLAAQRLSIHDVFSATPLIHLQSGVEVAVSSPWVSGSRDAPAPGAAAFTADGELAGNGWSVRPLSWHGRADLLLCRSISVEVGAGPELFRSTADPNRGLDYGLRWHVSGGFSFACPARTTPFSDVTLSAQYRARALLYNRDAPPAYDDRLLIALQYQPGPFAIAVFGSPDFHILGGRVQLELGGPP